MKANRQAGIKRKNYFAIVHKENGSLLVHSGALPIYWYKKLAVAFAVKYPQYTVQPVNIKELEKLILSKPNKKIRNNNPRPRG